MRAAALTGLLVLTAFAANANPLAAPDNEHFTLPSQDAVAGRYALARARADSALLGGDTARVHYTPTERGFSIGPLRADGAQEVGLGRRGGFKPHYRLEGVSVMGGSVGGTVDGRGAMLSLRWGG
jgi:hypothetical protein